MRQLARGDAIRRPRIDNLLPTSRPDEFFSFSSMEGGTRGPGYYALRVKPDIVAWPIVNGLRRRVTYASRPGLYGGLVLLYDVETAELVAIMNDGYVQHLRVAATAAVGMRYLAAPEARVLAIIGSGGMAKVFAHAAKAVRPIDRIQVYSPNSDHLTSYCQEMRREIDCDVVPSDSAEAAARDADILSLCTNSYDPVVRAEDIQPGMHVSNVMPNELSPEGHARIEVVGVLVRRTPPSRAGFVDDDFGFRVNVLSYAGGQPSERAKIPVGAPSGNRYPNARIVDCCEWDTGKTYQRASRDEITMLANGSHGMLEGEFGASAGFQGMQFACVAGRIYEMARELGRGTELPTEMFLQDIPT